MAALASHHLVQIGDDLIEVTPKGREYIEWRGEISAQAPWDSTAAETDVTPAKFPPELLRTIPQRLERDAFPQADEPDPPEN